MNVLIYSGPEVLQPSLNHALATLRTILIPHYTVQPITLHSLTTQPWQSTCALLVLPRSRNRFVSVASKQVKDFVEAGGAYLMLGTGATATPRSGGLGLGFTGLSLGLEAGEMPLKLFNKFNNVYLTFDEDVHDNRQKVVDLKTPEGDVVNGIYDPEATQFDGFDDLKGLDVLARYTSQVGEGAIAALSMDASKGRIALWGPSIEYPLQEEPLSSIIAESTNYPPKTSSLLNSCG
jgi:biotin--protein ligase